MASKQIDTDSILSGLNNNTSHPGAMQVGVAGYPQSPLEIPAEKVMTRGGKIESPKQRMMVHELDPKKCRRWRYYDRFEEWFTYEHCRDLIDDIGEREQEIPGIVRKLVDDPEGYEYEVIFGGRRHFAASYITEEWGIFKPFKALVKAISDQEAARLMDLENRKRADISGFERCVSLRQQMGRGPGYEPIFKTLNDLCVAIESRKKDGGSSNDDEASKTKAALSQMITAGEMNEIDELIGLFKGRRIKIPWSLAYHLMKKWNCGEDKVRKRISEKAKELKTTASDKAPEVILKELLAASEDPLESARVLYKKNLELNGKVAIKASATEKDLCLRISFKVIKQSNEESLLKLIKNAMSEASNT